LGHGVRIAEDLEEIAAEGDEVRVRLRNIATWVRDREIALEVAPSSNLQTGAIAQWGTKMEDHPFDLLYQQGFCVTVNTDNRLMSRTTLTRELALLVDTFEYGLEDLETLQLNAAGSAFLPLEQREELIELIQEGFERASRSLSVYHLSGNGRTCGTAQLENQVACYASRSAGAYERRLRRKIRRLHFAGSIAACNSWISSAIFCSSSSRSRRDAARDRAARSSLTAAGKCESSFPSVR